MKSGSITLLSALLLGITSALAQKAHYTKSGVIEYEKSVNMFAMLKKQLDLYKDDSFLEQAYDSYRKNQPQFKKLKSTLSFSDGLSEFVPAEPEESRMFFSNNAMVNQNNTIFTDFNSGTFISQK